MNGSKEQMKEKYRNNKRHLLFWDESKENLF